MKSTTASSLRLNTRDLLDQIQKHQEAQAKAQAIAAAAAVNLPKYYNPSSVNAVKLAEQQQKRKLLWSKKPDENANSVCTGTVTTVSFYFQLFSDLFFVDDCSSFLPYAAENA